MNCHLCNATNEAGCIHYTPIAQFQIEVVETLTRVITINAANEIEAIEQVRNMYTSGAIVLDSDDFVTYEINQL